MQTPDTTTFLRHYNEHIDDILTKPSGTHAPDPELLNQWISAQASERRRTAAKALADNIRYITHKELIERCNILIDKLYADPIPAGNKLKWYVGNKTKSVYFMSLICYHIVKEKKLRLPDEILIEFTEDDCPGSTIVWFDDMSYSGSQMSKLISLIFATELKRKLQHIKDERNVIELKKENSDELMKSIQFEDIRIGICFVTKAASDFLDLVNYDFFRLKKLKVIWDDPLPNPYKIYTTEIIPNLQDTLGPQLYADCVVYFSPYRNPNCICYLDHKVADSNSTFLNVLRFGPVLPSSIDYRFIYKHEERKYSWDTLKPYYTQQEETIDRQIEGVEFIPFIKGCSVPEDKKEELRSIPYHVLMLTSGGPDPDNEGKNIEYETYGIDNSAPIFAYKNSVELRCPLSWYKHEYFKGGAKKRRTIKRKAPLSRKPKRATASVRNGRRSN